MVGPMAVSMGQLKEGTMAASLASRMAAHSEGEMAVG
jgi:hypothetical protein